MTRNPRWVAAASTARVIFPRLDGTLDLADIAALTGLTEEEVEAALEPLVASGLVVFGDGLAPSPSITTTTVPPGIRSAPPPGALPQLGEEEQRRISDLYARLNKIDHYRLLGVAATADAKDIKRSYYALAKLYHPDRFFRKDVGPLRPKIQAIFAAMTTAMETLVDASRRAAYDAYLRDVLRTRIARRNAEALEGRKEFAAAAEVWARVVEQLPTDAYVQHRYAYALLRGRTRESFEAAVAAAVRSIELDPTRAEYRLTAASLYLATGRERSALAELEVAAELEQDRTDIAGLLAAVSERVYGARG